MNIKSLFVVALLVPSLAYSSPQPISVRIATTYTNGTYELQYREPGGSGPWLVSPYWAGLETNYVRGSFYTSTFDFDIKFINHLAPSTSHTQACCAGLQFNPSWVSGFGLTMSNTWPASTSSVPALTFTNAIQDIAIFDNFLDSTNSSPKSATIVATVATLRERDTRVGTNVTVGTRTAAAILTQPRYTNAIGTTNGVVLVGRYSSTLPSNLPAGGILISNTTFQFWDGSSWSTFASPSSITTNFPNIRVTNTVVAANATMNTLSLHDQSFPGSIITSGSLIPLLISVSTNGATRLSISNSYTSGGGAAAGIRLGAEGVLSDFYVLNTNWTGSTNRKARVSTTVHVGAGTQTDFVAPGTMDQLWSYALGTEFARLSTNAFTLKTPFLSLTASTNIPLYVLAAAADPTVNGSPVRIYSSTLPNLKNSLGIVAADIKDATTAGRTLLTSLPTPADGDILYRSNSAWAFLGHPGTNSKVLISTNSSQYLWGDITSGGASGNTISVNGTTNNWNFNDSTPAAPVGGVNVKWQVSSTNASAYVPFGPFTNSLVAIGATNTTAATNIVALTIPPLNNDGDSVSLEAVGWIYINSGGYVACPPRVYLDGTSLSSYNLNLGSAAYKKPWRLQARAIRTSSTTLAIQLSGIVGTGTDGYAVTGGYGAASSAYLVAIEGVSANPGAGTNRLGLGFSMNTASTNNYWSTIQMKGVRE